MTDPQAWLKAIGHARGPLAERWLEDGRVDLLSRTGFPRRPRIEVGDRLVYYASVWKRVFAVVEVTGEPTTAVEHPTNPQRWPWSLEVAPLLVIPRLEDAPPVEAIGVAPRSMSQQSHIRLRERHYELVRTALAGLL